MPRLYEAALSPWNWTKSRWRGTTPSPDEFRQSLWRGVHAQYAVRSSRNRRLVGLVSSYNFNPPASVHAAFMPAVPDMEGPPVVEALLQFVELTFRSTSVAKVYFEIPAFVGLDHSPFGEYISLEAVLRNYVYWDGELWDLSHWSLSRTAFDTYLNSLRVATQPGQDFLSLEAFRARLMAVCCLGDDTLQLSNCDSLALLETALLLEALCGLDAETTVLDSRTLILKVEDLYRTAIGRSASKLVQGAER